MVKKSTSNNSVNSIKTKDDQAMSISLPIAKLWTAIFFVLISLVFGFLGGRIAGELNNTDDELTISSSGQQIVLKESEVIADVVEKVSKSVVSINVTSTTQSGGFFFTPTVYETDSEGTGIILTTDGVIVTNKHVIPDNTELITIITSDGTEYEEVEIIGRDPFNDIAFLKIVGVNDLKPAKLGDSDEARVGDKVIAIGNALGEFDNTVTAGIISGKGRPLIAGVGIDTEQLSNLFQTDTAINPGNSGGPLVNVNGEVIAINTAIAGNAEGIGFAIPINDVKPGIVSVEQYGELKRPYLGVRYLSLTEEIAQELNLNVTQGALITANAGQNPILPDSPAEKAGLQDGDIITNVMGTDLDEANTLVTTVSQYQVGEKIELTVIREGEELIIEVELEEVPDSLAN